MAMDDGRGRDGSCETPAGEQAPGPAATDDADRDESPGADAQEPTPWDATAVGRRCLFRGGLLGLGGLAAAPLLPWGAGEAQAAPSDPDAGPAVPARPLPPIRKSGLAVRLIDFAAPPPTRPAAPRALLNTLHHANDGSGRIFTNDSRGKLWRLDPATGDASLFLNLVALRGDKLVKRTRQQGLRSFAFHPDHARPGTPGHRKLYTMSTETVSSRQAGVPLLDGPFTAAHDNVLCEWSVQAGDPQRVDTGSRREILRISKFLPDHSADQVMFDPNAQPGDANYGNLYVTVGDGGNTNPGDRYKSAQNKARALGKILCIDPLRQPNGRSYGIPADNPFVGEAGALPEVWALGLRHPQYLSFDQGGNGKMFIGDIGQANIEEINLGVRGGNYGWPLREGTFVTDTVRNNPLYALAADDASSGFRYPVAQYDRGTGRAIAGGYVYRGTAVPDLFGHYVFGDLVNGRVFHVPASKLVHGRQATIKELTLRRGGNEVTLLDLVAPSTPPGRCDMRFGQDEAGEVYVLTKQDGKVRKLAAAG